MVGRFINLGGLDGRKKEGGRDIRLSRRLIARLDI